MNEDQFLINAIGTARRDYDEVKRSALKAAAKEREAIITALTAGVEIGRVVEVSGYAYETIRRIARRAGLEPRTPGPRSGK